MPGWGEGGSVVIQLPPRRGGLHLLTTLLVGAPSAMPAGPTTLSGAAGVLPSTEASGHRHSRATRCRCRVSQSSWGWVQSRAPWRGCSTSLSTSWGCTTGQAPGWGCKEGLALYWSNCQRQARAGGVTRTSCARFQGRCVHSIPASSRGRGTSRSPAGGYGEGLAL